MKAAILDKGKIEVGDLPDPVPTAGQVLVRTNRCALCASDLHFLCSGHEIVSQSERFGGPYAGIDLGRPIVMGHEFVGEIVDYGPGSRRPLQVGARVTSLPVVLMSHGPGVIGYQNALPGGFGQLMLLDENLIMEVPSHVPDDLAALIEPLAVGLEHARVGEPKAGDVALVVGCGAIGLAVIAALKASGVAGIVAADLNAGRRAIALAMGADVAVDPTQASPYEPFSDHKIGKPNLVYECVGKSGMLHEMILGVGEDARIVIGGFALEPEKFFVPPAQFKRLKILFARGEEPQDMMAAMQLIADGKVNLRSWLGECIGLSGVAAAIDRLADPSSAVRTTVDPSRL